MTVYISSRNVGLLPLFAGLLSCSSRNVQYWVDLRGCGMGNKFERLKSVDFESTES